MLLSLLVWIHGLYPNEALITIETGDVLRAWLQSFLEPENQLPPFSDDTFAPQLRDDLLRLPALDNCFQMRSQTVIITGKPGSGKTTTMKSILQGRENQSCGIVVAAVFLNLADGRPSRASHILMQILAQLTIKRPRQLHRISELFKSTFKPGDEPPSTTEYKSPSTAKTVEVLVSLIEDMYTRDQLSVCVIMDAVDQCKDDLEQTLMHMRDIQLKTRIGLLITSRWTEDRSLNTLFPHAEVLPLVRPNGNQHIRAYIRHRIKSATLPLLKGQPALAEKVVERIASVAGAKQVYDVELLFVILLTQF